MESEESAVETQSRVREKIDYEQWVFQHRLEMTKVQAKGNLSLYENMLNTLINSFSPHWPDGFKEKWELARKIWHPEAKNPINTRRIEQKELLMAELMDQMGIGFTKKQKITIKGGVLELWKMFPPWPPKKNENGEKKSSPT